MAKKPRQIDASVDETATVAASAEVEATETATAAEPTIKELLIEVKETLLRHGDADALALLDRIIARF